MGLGPGPEQEASPGDAAGDRLRDVLDGLRSIAEPTSPAWRPKLADAKAIVDGAWSALAEALDDKPQAGAVLDLLRRLSLADDAMVRATKRPRLLGDVLGMLEAAPSTVAELVKLAPQLPCRLGFDRAILSHVVDGVWISEVVYVVDDPKWADEINRIGQEHPQPLVPGLHETEIVRRREAMIVTDVQHDANVHRRIADASRSRSYVGAPIMSGNHVVGLLHSDCYVQGRDPDAEDCETLATYARGLQIALTRAHLAEQLHSVGSTLRGMANDCQEGAAAVSGLTVWPSRSVGSADFTLAARATKQAVHSVRDVLTGRESQILELMAEGMSNGRIATQLVISEGTVKQHVKRILRKLRAGNRVEAVSMLYQSDRA
ncbi:MAG: LuxR C-terminal-related transcriptional regulator [Mycobacterium sp.]